MRVLSWRFHDSEAQLNELSIDDIEDRYEWLQAVESAEAAASKKK